MKKCFLISLLLLLIYPKILSAKIVEYELHINYGEVNITGKKVRAITINENIPGPTLYWEEGDEAVIKVYNHLDEETSIHWHGILVPNKEDGVSYLTTPPILPKTMREFRFPITHSGTYWYHSHTALQEQQGVYGAIVIYPKNYKRNYDKEFVLILSDWTNEDPKEVLKTLKRGSDYYLIKKGIAPSLYDAITKKALWDVIKQSIHRMSLMDISDVAYDAFLSNGKKEDFLEAKKGEKILLRVINAAAATYFYLNFAGGLMTVVSADGVDVEPVDLEQILIAIGETYDVLLTIPDDKSYEFRATAQDVSGFTSLFIGIGEKVKAKDMEKPDIYRMHKKNHKEHHPKDETVSNLPPYNKLKALKKTKIKESPDRIIRLILDGDMERYVWTINGKILSEATPIIVKKGEMVRIIFENRSMMHHPMHLHGHFFRVINDFGEYSPLKHSLDVPPMGEKIIEFYAGEDKDWALHCHILYHMKAGMMTYIHYEGSELDPEIIAARKLKTNDLIIDHYYFWGDIGLYTNMLDAKFNLSNSRNIFILERKNDWEKHYENELSSFRYIDRFFSLAAGIKNEKDDDTKIKVGFKYLLPLLIESKITINQKGDYELQLEKKLPIISKLSLNLEFKYDKEEREYYKIKAKYMLKKTLDISVIYFSKYKSAGVGIEYRF